MNQRLFLVYSGVLAVLVLTAASLRALEKPPSGAVTRVRLSRISTELAGWQTIRTERMTERQLSVLKTSDYIARAYEKDGTEAGVFVAYYAAQRAGEAMHSPRNCMPGEGWTITESVRQSIPFRDRTAEINRLRIENGGQKLVALYWYQSADQIIASEYVGKLVLIRDAIFRDRTDGALARIFFREDVAKPDRAVDLAASLMTQMDVAFRGEP